MKNFKSLILIVLMLPLALIFMQCEDDLVFNESMVDSELDVRARGGSKGKPVAEGAGNNLSFPVIFTEGEKDLRGDFEGIGQLDGEWWYVWGEDTAEPTDVPNSCVPKLDEYGDPVDPPQCLDGTEPWGSDEVYKAFLQKDSYNEWQASNEYEYSDLNVDEIDWGDNLESVPFTINSMVRTEVVLYEGVMEKLHYAMRHTSGWGSNEVHGLQTNLNNEPILGEGDKATVYTENARLTIQRLNVGRDEIVSGDLEWDSDIHEWIEAEGVEDDLINSSIFNMAVHEASDGPGYYNAEINVKGKIIYGYTWNVRRNNDGAGDYRITFSFDEMGGSNSTHFDEYTDILMPVEEFSFLSSSDGGGGVAEIDPDNNLTYIDITITPRTKGRR